MVGVRVFVCVRVKVEVGVLVFVGVRVFVWVSVPVGVRVFVAVFVKVRVGVRVFVAVRVKVRVGVRVFVGVLVKVRVGVRVFVGVRVLVRVGVAAAGFCPRAVMLFPACHAGLWVGVADRVEPDSADIVPACAEADGTSAKMPPKTRPVTSSAPSIILAASLPRLFDCTSMERFESAMYHSLFHARRGRATRW